MENETLASVILFVYERKPAMIFFKHKDFHLVTDHSRIYARQKKVWFPADDQFCRRTAEAARIKWHLCYFQKLQICGQFFLSYWGFLTIFKEEVHIRIKGPWFLTFYMIYPIFRLVLGSEENATEMLGN